MNHFNFIKKHFLKLLILSIVSFITILLTVKYSTTHTGTYRITKTERVSERYLIFTDKEVLKNVDDLFFLKFDSSDVYGKLSSKQGQVVKLTVQGLRVPLFSWYRNVIKVEQ